MVLFGCSRWYRCEYISAIGGWDADFALLAGESASSARNESKRAQHWAGGPATNEDIFFSRKGLITPKDSKAESKDRKV
jgi:hypothetical protein